MERPSGLLRLAPLVAAVTLAGCGKSAEIAADTEKSVWELVFKGKIGADSVRSDGRGVELTVTKPTTYADLRRRVIERGERFKVSKEEGAGGGSGGSSYPCSEVGVGDNDHVFMCYGPRVSSSGFERDAVYEGAVLTFDDMGRTFYVPLENQPDTAGAINLSLFATDK